MESPLYLESFELYDLQEDLLHISKMGQNSLSTLQDSCETSFIMNMNSYLLTLGNKLVSLGCVDLKRE